MAISFSLVLSIPFSSLSSSLSFLFRGNLSILLNQLSLVYSSSRSFVVPFDSIYLYLYILAHFFLSRLIDRSIDRLKLAAIIFFPRINKRISKSRLIQQITKKNTTYKPITLVERLNDVTPRIQFNNCI